jgi:periplasmic protein TonB
MVADLIKFNLPPQTEPAGFEPLGTNDNGAQDLIRPGLLDWRVTLPPPGRDYRPLIASVLFHALVFGSATYVSSMKPPEPPRILEISLISEAAPENIPLPGAAPAPVKAPPVPRSKPEETKQKSKTSPVRQTAQSDAVIARKTARRGEGKKQQIAMEVQGAKNSSSVTSFTGTGETGRDKPMVIPVVTNAQYRHQFPPEYPKRARERGQQGKVILQALVDTGGKTREVKIVKSSGFNLLDEAALVAVRKWEFAPMRRDGKIVLSWVQVPVQFLIN